MPIRAAAEETETERAAVNASIPGKAKTRFRIAFSHAAHRSRPVALIRRRQTPTSPLCGFRKAVMCGTYTPISNGETDMLNIESKRNAAELTVALSGRLDTNTAPELEKALNTSLEGVNMLFIDMEKLDYISSAGLRVLLAAQKIMNEQGKMTITHVNKAIMEIFEVTGLSDILTIA
jgi:anti-sigma B factor antagonist